MKHPDNIYNLLVEKNPYIKKHQRKTLGHFLIKLALIEIIIIAMIVLPKKITGYEILFGIVLCVLLPFVFLKPREIFEKQKVGKITNVAYITHKAPREDRVLSDFLKSPFVTWKKSIIKYIT